MWRASPFIVESFVLQSHNVKKFFQGLLDINFWHACYFDDLRLLVSLSRVLWWWLDSSTTFIRLYVLSNWVTVDDNWEAASDVC